MSDRPSRGLAPLLALCVALALAVPGGAAAPPSAEPAPWVGRRAVAKFGAILQVDGRRVDDEDVGKTRARGRNHRASRVYQVKRASGPWVWVEAERSGSRGWIQPESLVPFDEAIASITGVIREAPADASLYNWRANVWMDRGEHDIAIGDSNEAIRLDLSDAAARIGRAEVFRYRKDYEKAIADDAEAIRLHPTEASAFGGRGQARRGTKEYEKALADFEESTRLDPDGWGPYEKVLVRLTTGRPEAIGDARGDRRLRLARGPADLRRDPRPPRGASRRPAGRRQGVPRRAGRQGREGALAVPRRPLPPRRDRRRGPARDGDGRRQGDGGPLRPRLPSPARRPRRRGPRGVPLGPRPRLRELHAVPAGRRRVGEPGDALIAPSPFSSLARGRP